MKLHELLQGLQVVSTNADPNLEITGVSYDSRQVAPGDLFIAIAGFAVDGHRFIPMAFDKGAAVVLCQQAPESGCYVQVPDTRRAMALLSANWFGHPARQMKMIGVTGTNGKTTVTTVLKSVLETARGARVGLIGTIQNMIGDRVLHTERTTPESFELQKLLRQMADAGCSHVIMEVSSHALVLDRVGGIHYDVGAFTNLTEDHLDFHKTMQNYAEAKAELFARCDAGVINLDDDYAPLMLERAACPVCTTSTRQAATLSARNIRLESDHVAFDVAYQGREEPVWLGIPGGFTVYNSLTVIGIALQLGLSLEETLAALRSAGSVKGRVEVVPTPGTDYTVLIDYAHTPDALENVLDSVQGYCKGRVIAVFGCGGDRDPIKRPIMGRIGVEHADLAVITSDNPRTEDPMAIIEDILAGVRDLGKPYEVICDRRAAIRWAMDHARKDDIIVLAGKGHETYQTIGTENFHLDEREEVAAHLQER